MRKFFKSMLILAILAVVFGAVGVVFAQSSTPQTSNAQTCLNEGYDLGKWNNRGGRASRGGMFGGNQSCPEDGLLHDEIMAAIADELGISVEDLEARREAGETMAEIAISTGLTLEEFKTLMADIRTAVVDQALADGTLTEEHAEWMKSRGAGMPRGHGARAKGGRFSRGMGECPYDESTP
jgi:hypothetical protein